jgi:hypothetical protein
LTNVSYAGSPSFVVIPDEWLDDIRRNSEKLIYRDCWDDGSENGIENAQEPMLRG